MGTTLMWWTVNYRLFSMSYLTYDIFSASDLGNSVNRRSDKLKILDLVPLYKMEVSGPVIGWLTGKFDNKFNHP